MVIYADVLFLINFIFDCLTLIILGKFMKLRVRTVRIIAASALGAAGTAAIFCLNAKTLLLKTALALVMILCAYGFNGKRTLKIFAAFLFIMAAVSGLVMLLISVIPAGADSVIRNGIIYFDVSGKLLFAFMLISYPLPRVISKCVRERKNRSVYATVIEKSGKSVTVNALFDSGNTLKEPVTGRPVVVAEWLAVRSLFDENVEFDALLDKAEEYRLWFIPYRSVGNDGKTLPAFMADRVEADKHITEHVFIGLTGKTISNEYQALLNAELI